MGCGPTATSRVHRATARPLTDAGATVNAIRGETAVLVADALAAASGRDAYVDGGKMVRAALAAGLLDDLVVTMLPTLLGEGVRVLDASVSRRDLTMGDIAKYRQGFVQVHYRCRLARSGAPLSQPSHRRASQPHTETARIPHAPNVPTP